MPIEDRIADEPEDEEEKEIIISGIDIDPDDMDEMFTISNIMESDSDDLEELEFGGK